VDFEFSSQIKLLKIPLKYVIVSYVAGKTVTLKGAHRSYGVLGRRI